MFGEGRGRNLIFVTRYSNFRRTPDECELQKRTAFFTCIKYCKTTADNHEQPGIIFVRFVRYSLTVEKRSLSHKNGGSYEKKSILFLDQSILNIYRHYG